MLLTAIGSMSTALGVMWRALLKKDKETTNLRKQLDDLHADHVEDVKTLTRETIELARAATYAPPLTRSEQPPPDSED